MAIDWKAMAHHQRYKRRLAELDAINVKRRLWEQHDARLTLVNAMIQLLPRLAIYGAWCRACDSRVDAGHRDGCRYVQALAAVNAAAKVHA